MKSIIKEIFIILLLIVAIVLALGILFYEYTPTTKKIPSKVAEYSLPEDMVEELEETIQAAQTQNIIQTYRVDAGDLANYIKTDNYVQGKINPFDKISSTTGTNNQNNNENNTSETNSTSQNKNQSGFFNEVK